MLTKEQLNQALKKLENNTSNKPEMMTEETYQRLLKLSPKERAKLAQNEAEKRGFY